MPPSDLILITGGTGHLGFRTLRYALECGYRVRAVVRSAEKEQKLRSHALLKNYTDDTLSFVIIPDFLAEGAFTKAVNGVKYIIHIASPLATGAPDNADAEKYFIQPAVEGTIGVLKAAHDHGKGILRVIITSSIAALFPKNYMDDPSKFPDFAVSSQRHQEYPHGPFPNTMAKYSASKLAALIRAEEFVRLHMPAFDVIHVHPAYIYGRDDLAETKSDFETGTNRIVLDPVLGTARTDAFMSAWIHVDDVARIHVQALDANVQGNQSFVVAVSDVLFSWDDVCRIVARRFAQAVRDGRLLNNGSYRTVYVPFDVTKTIDTFGPFKGFEETVVSVVGHYLEVLSREK
ncbi:Hypothetical protein R9X50_00699800 [Acrodontium crateriforme]|uniref:NAD-dependent epimerase/dehydratase domain-containing protein n=1 Tax=Acrodontium crateriforme TaxID=150365 RepID=A0AAQ3MB37_9PEZI|nr:Hypothetical protein R9X50_00699800 [Acrodontium crateriforme]